MPALESTRREFLQSLAAGLGAAPLGLALSGCSQSKKRPNIILLLTDDQRYDALGCAGNPIIQTPNMDLLAQNGVRFSNAFVTSPICAASRASIFTSLYERTHRYTFTKPPLQKEFFDRSYPALLRKAGYRTGFVGKFGINVPEGTISDWFDVYQPSGFPYFQKIDGKEKHLTDINMDRAIEFIRDTGREQPFCLSLSTWAPHAHDGEEAQYFWPRACDSLYADVTIPPPALGKAEFFASLPEFVQKSMNRERWYWRFDTPEKYQRMVKGYYRMISGVDLALGRLMEELKHQGILNQTVIILMSDNGYFLGERGFAGKWSMHDLSIRIPLIIFDPRQSGRQNGLVRDEAALNIDVAPTVLEYAGLPIPDLYQGRSLIPVLEKRSEKERQEWFCEHLWDHPDIPQTECVRSRDWKYIRYPQHPEVEELYDLHSDPQEEFNLAGKAELQNHLKDLRSRCDRFFQGL